MPIGGIDVILVAPAQECLGDLILRTCRRHWPHDTCYFQDALDEKNIYPVTDPWVWAKGTASKEFFVYPNEDAVKAWEDGPTAANANTMFHFIIGEPDAKNDNTVEVTVVVDKMTKDIKVFLKELAHAFQSIMRARPLKKWVLHEQSLVKN